MTILSRQSRTRASWQSLLAIALVIYPLTAGTTESPSLEFELRNHNPFLQVFGLPPFQSAILTPEDEFALRVNVDLANNSDAGDTPAESAVIDGETYLMTMSFRRRVAPWLELGVDLPFIAHTGGFMDNAIESWHDIFGISNTRRRNPRNQLNFLYERDGNTVYNLGSSTTGIGDVQLTGAVPVRRSADGGADISLRASLKLPTGNEARLHGSGAIDFAAAIYACDTRTIFNSDLRLGAFLGVLVLGNGEVLPEIQRNAVPFGGASVTWQATDRLALSTQLHVQGAYFDSDINELGGNTLQLAVGAGYHFPGRNLSLRLALIEDVSADATTDFALHFGLQTGGGLRK